MHRLVVVVVALSVGRMTCLLLCEMRFAKAEAYRGDYVFLNKYCTLYYYHSNYTDTAAIIACIFIYREREFHKEDLIVYIFSLISAASHNSKIQQSHTKPPTAASTNQPVWYHALLEEFIFLRARLLVSVFTFEFCPTFPVSDPLLTRWWYCYRTGSRMDTTRGIKKVSALHVIHCDKLIIRSLSLLAAR